MLENGNGVLLKYWHILVAVVTLGAAVVLWSVKMKGVLDMPSILIEHVSTAKEQLKIQKIQLCITIADHDRVSYLHCIEP